MFIKKSTLKTIISELQIQKIKIRSLENEIVILEKQLNCIKPKFKTKEKKIK